MRKSPNGEHRAARCTKRKLHNRKFSWKIVDIPTDTHDETVWLILSRSVGDPTPSKMSTIREIYRAPARELLTVEADGECVGCIGYERGKGVIEITNIAVLQTLERRGIGRALIQAVAARFPDFRLEAETDGEAVGFYKASGFDAVPCHRRSEFQNRWTCSREAQSEV